MFVLIRLVGSVEFEMRNVRVLLPAIHLALALCLLMLGMSLFMPGCDFSESPQNSDNPAKNEQIRLRWFEQKLVVFHGIPVNIKFAIRQNELSVEQQGQHLKEVVSSVFERVNAEFNAFSDSSELGKLNQQTSLEPLTVSQDMLIALKLASEMYEKTGGAFDPTVWPFKKVWNQAKKTGILPNGKELLEQAQHVGMGKVTFTDSPPSIKKQVNELQFDFGGFVKGLAVDWITADLKKEGITQALVQCGGETRIWGLNADEVGWRIGVQHPVDMQAMDGAIQSEREIAISTSGNYRQPIQIGEQTYYHIFDPKTGQPISTDVLGVTVIAVKDRYANAKADAWATALAVLGAEKGIEFARKNDIEVMFLIKDDARPGGIRRVLTEGFTAYYQPISP